MTNTTVTLLLLVAVQAAAIVVLLIHRSRRIRDDHALRESEERFRLMADRAPVIVWTARPDTTLDYVNSTCVEFTGRTFEQLVDEGWLDFVHPEDVDRCMATYVPAFEARRPFLLEYRIRHVDGDYRWLMASGIPKYGPEGAFAGYIGCDVDITERKNAEDRIRENQVALELSHREIQHLAGRLIEAQNAERARIARDLHDDVSQQLAGMSIAFSALKQRLTDSHVSKDLEENLRALHQRASTLAQSVRHLSHDLHPTVLRHAGLVAALTSYCAELERTHGIRLMCTAEGDVASIAPEAALCLYRIAQEALRNVIAHAGASQVDIQLLRSGDIAEMRVTDDGKGFDVSRSPERSRGLGLVSIAERVRLAGGTVNIVSETNKGTRVSVRIPANPVVEVTPGSGATRVGSGVQSLVGRTHRQSQISMRRTTVLLADDHAIVTEGLAGLLTKHDFDVVGAVNDGRMLIEAAARLHPDVIVTDLSMPGLSGLDVIARLKADGIESKIIVLTMHNDADLATVALRSGASGFLLKESAGDELVAAIRQAVQGRVYLTPALTKDVMERMAGAHGAAEPQLSVRQLDVLRLIVKGQRMKEIAANLGLSVRTVETHKYEMMETLGLHSTAELVRYALDRRLTLD